MGGLALAHAAVIGAALQGGARPGRPTLDDLIGRSGLVDSVRTSIRPGDAEAIVALHRSIYTREQGFDETFATYVAVPLNEFAARSSARERLWIVEKAGAIVGCVAVVEASADEAQLRWYLVDPSVRGSGLGTALLDKAVDFARGGGYRAIFLWTVGALAAAARRYTAAGFERVEERPGMAWGVRVVEEKYRMSFGTLDPDGAGG